MLRIEARNAETPIEKKPEWIRTRATMGPEYSELKGLVKREGKPGRRHGRFSPTEKGQRLYDIISDMGVERSEFLMESIPDDRLQIFLATFDKIRRNASAQLDRERAFEELESG